MTALTGAGDLAAAFSSYRRNVYFNKASIANAVAGQYFSLWRATGLPVQPPIPTTALIPTKATAGAPSFENGSGAETLYLKSWAVTQATVGQTMLLVDRVGHMGGLSGNSTATQTVGVDLTTLAADRRGASDFSEIQWFLEWYQDTGATASNATIGVTYDDGSTGNLPVVAVGGTVRAGRMIPLLPAVAGRYIKEVDTAALSALTGTAGNFGVTAVRPLTYARQNIASVLQPQNWAECQLPDIPNDACIALMQIAATTSTGASNATLVLTKK